MKIAGGLFTFIYGITYEPSKVMFIHKGREGTNARCLRSGQIQTDTAKFPQIGRFHILGVEGYRYISVYILH
jgi:hypothetical protein